MPIPHDPEKRCWVEVAESNQGLVDSFRGALVEFLAFDRDRIPYLVGSGFIAATSPEAALVVSAKHVFSEGVLKVQRPVPGHAPSAIFMHRKDRDPSLEPDKLKVIYKGGATPTMLNAIYLNYDDSLDLAACVLVPQENETIAQGVAIPLDTGQPSVGAVVHMVSLYGLKADEQLPPQARDGKGQAIVTSRGTSIRVGIVTGVYPTGFRQYKWPCFTTSIPAEPGMSGGFVYLPRENVTIAACGVVCADNSTEEARHNFFKCGESVIAFAWSALALRLPLSFPNQQTEHGHTLYEMIRLGHVPLPLGGIDQIRIVETGNGGCRIARL